jgi:hypothetical protein
MESDNDGNLLTNRKVGRLANDGNISATLALPQFIIYGTIKCGAMLRVTFKPFPLENAKQNAKRIFIRKLEIGIGIVALP